jgi:hypothetical protein
MTRNNQQSLFFDQYNQYVTQLPAFRRIPKYKLNLKDRPNVMDKEDMTCILADGSRIFLHERQITIDDHNSMTTRSFNLLSKPFREVIEEANQLEVQHLMFKKTYEQRMKQVNKKVNTKKKVASNKSDSILWVDKYAPQSFSQVGDYWFTLFYALNCVYSSSY